MREQDINYYTEPVEKFRKLVSSCRSKERLVEVLKEYEIVAWDALDAVEKFTDKDFRDFMDWERAERKGKFQGEEKALQFSMIIMPESMFKVSVIESQFGVPWGTAFIRMKEAGRLTIENGKAICK